MPRPLRHADASTVALTESALADLRTARDKLAKAGAVAAAHKVRGAITSTLGAVRHADRRRAAASLSPFQEA